MCWGQLGGCRKRWDLMQTEQPDAAVPDVNLIGRPVYPVAEKLGDMRALRVLHRLYTA
jgi:hypothetical protein